MIIAFLSKVGFWENSKEGGMGRFLWAVSDVIDSKKNDWCFFSFNSFSQLVTFGVSFFLSFFLSFFQLGGIYFNGFCLCRRRRRRRLIFFLMEALLLI